MSETIRLREKIIFENDDVIVLDKPAGLLSIPDREGKEISIKKILQEKFGNIFTIHRLDKETSGVIVFAKNENTHRDLSAQFEDRQTVKFYHGLVIGTPAEASGRIEARIAEHPVKKGLMVINRKGKEAITDYEVIESFGKYSFLKFRIHTGRTHQIRVHMKNIGNPIVCDPLYGDGLPFLLSTVKSKFKLSRHDEEERPILGRLALHSSALTLKVRGEDMTFAATLPKDIRASIQQLKKRKKD